VNVNEQVSQAFRQLYLGKRTGALLSEAGDVKRSVFFKSGFLASARSSLKEDRLGEVMVRRGRITAQHLEDASLFIKSGLRLGRILGELRIVPEEEIESFVRVQLLDIACSLLIQPPRRLAFTPLSEVESVLAAPLSVADVIMEAARRTTRVGSFLRRLKEDNRRLGFSSNPLLRFQSLTLTPEEGFILSRIDGQEPARGIMAVSPLSEEQTARTLWGLMAAGLVEPEGERDRHPVDETTRTAEPQSRGGAAQEQSLRPEVERLYLQYQGQNHWQVLGLARGASPEQMKAAFNELARRYHPDRFQRIVDTEFHEKLSFVFHRISEAYTTLSQRSEAGRYEKLAEKETQYEEQKQAWQAPVSSASAAPSAAHQTVDPSAAKALFARARKAYDKQDYWETIQLCRQAIEIAKDRAEHFHLLGLALSHNPKWRVDAEQNLKIATHLDPWKPEYFVALGELYRRAGLHVRARKVFEQAKAIDPNFTIPEN
jgi:tetratricopeptide (TPR) repeat protein